jgi:UDP-N-acetylmuramate--alanine ligase
MSMHIYFSAIGGAGIGPLALIAHQAGFEVSGSDKQDSRTIEYLRQHGITNIHIGQSQEQIAEINDASPIDWLVYSSAVILENPDSDELKFCLEHSIKTSKRDQFLNFLITEKQLSLIAIAGTHGKSTTTAMIIWLFKQLGVPISYSLGAKISFGDSGYFDPKSKYFIYEADEFDNNFLSFKPKVSVISGITWDHHEIFKTRNEYKSAFRQFIDQSEKVFMHLEDVEYLGIDSDKKINILNETRIDTIKLAGKYNRMDALLSVEAVSSVTNTSVEKVTELINSFPGLERRMEEIVPNLYSDYAHTPEKIKAAMDVAIEMSEISNRDIYVIYEPLTNRRQHYIKDQYNDSFKGAKHVYWIPSYLAREDFTLPILNPSELITFLPDPSLASVAEMNQTLFQTITDLLDQGAMVIALNGGGGGGLDEWLRTNFKKN